MRNTANLHRTIWRSHERDLYRSHCVWTDAPEVVDYSDLYNVRPGLTDRAERNAALAPSKALRDVTLGPVVKRLRQRARKDRELSE